MTRGAERDLDERIGDFLDGRMSPADRAAFVTRLARDPDLLARVDRLRTLGRALRESEVTLPAGLVERARARFEAETGRTTVTRLRPRPRWAIPLATAGLVAASLMLVLLFLPQDRRPDTSPGDVPGRLVQAKGKLEQPAPPEQELPRAADKKNEQSKEILAPLADELESKKTAKQDLDESDAIEPREMPVRSARLSDSPTAPTARAVQKAAEPKALGSTAAPAEAVSEPTLVWIDSASSAEWRAWISTAEGQEAATRLAPNFAVERVVLVRGSETALDCAGAWAEPTPAEILLHVTARPAAGVEPAEPARGCAFVLPRDPRPVRIVE